MVTWSTSNCKSHDPLLSDLDDFHDPGIRPPVGFWGSIVNVRNRTIIIETADRFKRLEKMRFLSIGRRGSPSLSYFYGCWRKERVKLGLIATTRAAPKDPNEHSFSFSCIFSCNFAISDTLRNVSHVDFYRKRTDNLCYFAVSP